MPTEYVTCPRCGHQFALSAPTPVALSSLAQAILTCNTDTARQWRAGRPVSLMNWSKIVYAGKRQVHTALRELVRAGYATTIPYGQKGRVQYVGVPFRVQRFLEVAA